MPVSCGCGRAVGAAYAAGSDEEEACDPYPRRAVALAALDDAIAATPDETERLKLVRVRDGLLGAAKDVALAYLEKKVGG
jgi:hypothetical protein